MLQVGLVMPVTSLTVLVAVKAMVSVMEQIGFYLNVHALR